MVGKAPRRHAAAVTDELLPGVLQGAAPAGLGAVKPEGGIGWRLTVRWDRLDARRRHALRGVRLGHFTPPSSGGLHYLPDPVAAPTEPGPGTYQCGILGLRRPTTASFRSLVA